MTAVQKTLCWYSLLYSVLCQVVLCATDYVSIKSGSLVINGNFVDGANGWAGVGSNSSVTAEEYYETPNSLALGPGRANVTQVIKLSQVDPRPLFLYGAVLADDDALSSEEGPGEYGIGMGFVYTDGTEDYLYLPWLLQESWSWAQQNAKVERGQPIEKITLSVSMLHSSGRVFFDDLAFAEDQPSTASTEQFLATTTWEENNGMQTAYVTESESIETYKDEWVPEENGVETIVDHNDRASSIADNELAQETTDIDTTETTATTATIAVDAVKATYLPPVDCACQEWSEYSQCSHSCGGGVSVRHRNCTEGSNGGVLCTDLGLEAPTMTESRECNTHQCVTDQLLHKDSFTEATGSHWVSVGMGFQMSKQTPAQATGTYSIQVNPSAGGFAGAFQAVDIKQDQPRRITVSAYAMADKPTSPTDTLPHPFAVLLEVTDTFGLGTNISLPFDLPTPGQWDYLDYYYDPPVKVERMRLLCLTYNLTYSAYCGDIFLQQGPVVAIDPACQCSDWSTWGQCSTDCGVGLHNRTRTCQDNSPACEELGIVTRQTETCQMPGSCPSNCTCGEWSTFGACSVRCGSGMQVRSRVCAEAAYGGTTCSALELAANETQPCIGLEGDCTTSIVGTENLLHSGGFEDSTNNWMPVGQGFKLVNSTFVDGQSAAALLPSDSGPAVSGMRQAVSLPTENNLVLGLSCNWYFSQDALASLRENPALARMQLRIDAIGGRRRALSQEIATVVAAAVKPNQWTWLGLRYQVPRTAIGITVSILSRHVGEPVLVDQVRLVTAQAANLSDDCTCGNWVHDTTDCGNDLSKPVLVTWTRSCIEAAEGGKTCAALNMADKEQRPCDNEASSQAADTMSQTAKASSEKSSGGLSTGAIIGVVLGSVAGLLLVGGGVWMWRHKHNDRIQAGHGGPGLSGNLPSTAANLLENRKTGPHVAKASDPRNLREKVNAWRETMYKERLMEQPDLNTVE